MAHPNLAAATRTERGNGPTGRLRRQGLVPGVLYNPPGDSIAFSVPQRELRRALHAEGGLGVVELSIDGGAPQTAVLVDRDLDPVRGDYWHVDFRKATAAAIAEAVEAQEQAEAEAEERAALAAAEPVFAEPEGDEGEPDEGESESESE